MTNYFHCWCLHCSIADCMLWCNHCALLVTFMLILFGGLWSPMTRQHAFNTGIRYLSWWVPNWLWQHSFPAVCLDVAVVVVIVLVVVWCAIIDPLLSVKSLLTTCLAAAVTRANCSQCVCVITFYWPIVNTAIAPHPSERIIQDNIDSGACPLDVSSHPNVVWWCFTISLPLLQSIWRVHHVNIGGKTVGTVRDRFCSLSGYISGVWCVCVCG